MPAAKRRCAARKCTTMVNRAALMCGDHWSMVPAAIKREVSEAYKERGSRPSAPIRIRAKTNRSRTRWAFGRSAMAARMRLSGAKREILCGMNTRVVRAERRSSCIQSEAAGTLGPAATASQSSSTHRRRKHLHRTAFGAVQVSQQPI